ncbi:hypothetical protein MS3_00008193 [Schistosoma haematobium]|uniref:DUF7083 domain-containing protein n=1 Tax=Schistosoma haematobium TaxID=6185 RepID=A0A6A5D7A2_SCHHA|nr:hypothetical protein MS3_00008193 [Schistosoma haematobium]KAH9593693.1 hypothetical protein MS3_00008193 [Schistosoma haematobium]CAH8431535.1 unnamed protein product [Schistosoma haematobium]
MSFTFDQFEALLEKQEKRCEQFQIRILEALTQQMNVNQNGLTDDPSKSHVDHIINSVHEFHFDGLTGVTFESQFIKYEDVFKVNLEKFDDVAKVGVMLRKLGTGEHERYTNFILPKNPRYLSFDATVVTLSQIFGKQSSLFNIRYEYLKLAKAGIDDWVQHASVVNKNTSGDNRMYLTQNYRIC